MKNKKKNTPAQRLGAAALATATVVSGLAFGPGAVAAPAASMSVTSADTPAADASTDDFGSVSALEVPATELVRGETSELKFMVRNTQEHVGFAPKVVLTAPEGTTFPEQATASSRYKATTADG
ncbi:hypothetical protein SOM11_14290, partial [Frigoribacterium sp. CFBP9039]|uniref:hypothetical protein n=1 Tax=Frigoribacterium sp. CFBP9029 TaxID=3096541 RepID=UPI002A69951C